MKTSKIVLKIFSGTVSVLIVILLIFGVFTVGTIVYDFGYRIFAEESIDVVDGKDVSVQIVKGMTGKELAEILKEKGLIRQTLLFQVQYRISDFNGKIKPGLYTLNTTMTPETMIETLSTVVEE
jgi:UPF0755 protein